MSWLQDETSEFFFRTKYSKWSRKITTANGYLAKVEIMRHKLEKKIDIRRNVDFFLPRVRCCLVSTANKR